MGQHQIQPKAAHKKPENDSKQQGIPKTESHHSTMIYKQHISFMPFQQVPSSRIIYATLQALMNRSNDRVLPSPN
jgi:hypothetical protein